MLVQNFQLQYEQNWELPLLIVCPLTLPVSNTFVERLFSLMKQVKTPVGSSMGNLMLNCVIRICQEGPPLDKSEGTSALTGRTKVQGKVTSLVQRKNVIETLVDVSFNDVETLFPEEADDIDRGRRI